MAIRASDTGKGISPTHLDAIFEKFFREDGSRPSERGGAGRTGAIGALIAFNRAARIGSEGGPAGSRFVVVFVCKAASALRRVRRVLYTCLAQGFAPPIGYDN